MDKGKGSSKRSIKSKGLQSPGDFIALGAKSRSSTSDADAKYASVASHKPSSSGSGDKKRDIASSSASSLAAKKPKLSGHAFTPLGRDLDRKTSSSVASNLPHYDEFAKDVNPSEFLDAVSDADENGDEELVDKLLCGAVRYLRQNRAKPGHTMFLSLLYLVKTRPSMFSSETVIEAFCSLLKRDVSINFKAKGNPLVSVLICNVLMIAFQDEENWPDNFLKVYLEDSMGERVWVDRKDCKAFVDNIQTAFNTKLPKSSMINPADLTKALSELTPSSSPLRMAEDDDSRSIDCSEGSEKTPDDAEQSQVQVTPRYTYQQVSVESYTLDLIREILMRRQGIDSSNRNLLRLMTVTCGYSEVRMLASTRLEMWLQNPKLTRPAQDLLMSLCMNTDQHSQTDVEVMSVLGKIRLKTKPLIMHYILSVKELFNQHADNLRTMMTHTVYNELSTSRNPNNMSLLSAMFQHSSDDSARILAEIFQDLLTNRDDYLRALRALFREIIRVVRQDMNFSEFALGLMQERSDSKVTEMDPSLKDRFLLSLTDMITFTAILSVSPSIREAASLSARGELKDAQVLRTFQHQVAVIQRDAVWWLHTVVPKMFQVKPNEYSYCLRKVLFMEKPESYSKVDNWPPESDRVMLLKLVSEVPTLEDTLMRVLVIGLTRDLHISAADALDLADQLVKRAAVLQVEGFDVLQVERLELIDAVLNLCAYHHPENIALPKGYQPPTLAISNLYYKAWILLLVIAAYNPATFGLAAWQNYPTLKLFMEMTMTNNYNFPPPTMITHEKSAEEICNHEKQVVEVEKQAILEFESHLAAASTKTAITESNSLLLSQLTIMEPSGSSRRPPGVVVEQMKNLNHSLKIGQKLCASRSPDFLLDVIQRQGTSQSMPWLAELVESSEGSLDVLPVQCLCEFLLHYPTESSKDPDVEDDGKTKKSQKHKKQEQLLSRLQTLLHSYSTKTHTIREILHFFFKRLSSQQSAAREQAVKGLSMVLNKSHIESEDTDESDMDVDDSIASRVIPSHKWLLTQLPALPLFDVVKSQACLALRQACQIETDINAVGAYIIFLAEYSQNLQLQELDDVAYDMAQLIVERLTIMNNLLPQSATESSEQEELVLTSLQRLFNIYLSKARAPHKESYSWSNTQDQILLQWTSGESATMNILVVHAMIILLTFGKPKVGNDYGDLMDAWFPENEAAPSAYLVDTSEEALLLPDWLKLRMIRATSDRLVDAALQDLEPAQLLLFVQSFGIPVASMSKLLCHLDSATRLDQYSMEQVVADKKCMAQLVEVQLMRGASGGQHFYTMLTHGHNKADSPPPEDDRDIFSPKRKERSVLQLNHIRTQVLSSQDLKQIHSLLYKILALSDDGRVLPLSERTVLAKNLHKSLAADDEFADALVECFQQIVQSCDEKAFINALISESAISSPLFRLLIAKQSKMKQREKLQFVAERIVQLSASYKANSLSAMARQLLRAHKRGTAAQIRTQQNVVQTFKSVDVMKGAEATREYDLKRKMQERRTDAERVHLLKTLILQAPPSEQGDGLFVDWIELLDPEVITTSPEIQEKFLFVNNRKDGTDGGGTGCLYQAYLLALLTHQCSAAKLQRCISDLLQRRPSKFLYPTPVLDFLWACTHIPKLWQGREKKTPKNYEPEDVLGLRCEQIQTLVDYVVMELSSLWSAEDCALSSHAERLLDQRLQLLLQCCTDKQQRIFAVVDLLQDKIKKNDCNKALYQHILVEVYTRIPATLNRLDDTIILCSETKSSQNSLSQLDTVTHRLLTTMGNAKSCKSGENIMYDANIACRKLASQHPLLVLRQLPMMSAFLQGRVQFSFAQLKQQNHLLLFTHFLGILELLQPIIYQQEYKSLDVTLNCYFDLIQAHGLQNRQLGALINKFVKFLHNYVTYAPARATKILQKHVEVLSAVSEMFNELSQLKSLLAGLTLPRHDSQSSESTDLKNKDGIGSLVPARPSSPINALQLTPFLQRISKNNSLESVIEVLQDLDESSKRKFEILEYFVDDIKRLMLHYNDMCRNMAHSLMMRYLRQKPSGSGQFVQTFKQCLISKQVDVIMTALRNMAEFCLLSREYSSSLLQKAFVTATNRKVNAGQYIIETLQLLNLETLQ